MGAGLVICILIYNYYPVRASEQGLCEWCWCTTKMVPLQGDRAHSLYSGMNDINIPVKISAAPLSFGTKNGKYQITERVGKGR